jgi:site-specific recombinase XerD
MSASAVGPLVQSFFIDGLVTMKGLRPASVRSYRDAMRLWLTFVAADTGRRITRLTLEDLSFERVLRFLQHLETARHNHIRTRNQRLAMLHTFFAYLATRVPEMLAVAERVAAIPTKRVPPAETRFLEREELRSLFGALPGQGARALRDRALLLFLYNTGARVQEVADLHVVDLDLTPPPRVRLHGKGDKWRTCPLWGETAQQLQTLLARRAPPPAADAPVFTSRHGRPLTRYGIYKLVRRHTAALERQSPNGPRRRIGPHVFRHTTAMHLLEAGVEVNVIRGWLGHVSLDTTHRYAEINVRAKEAALRTCEPPAEASAGFPRTPVWRTDESLLAWLNAL